MKGWKVQKFFGDLVYDLRSRGLLPLAILLIVAIIAVPIAITRGGSQTSPAPSSAVASDSGELAPETQAAVLAYSPGVRNYKQRLQELEAKDPFHQQFPAASSAASAFGAIAGDSTGGSSGGGLQSTEIIPGVGGEDNTSGGGTTGGGGGSKRKTKTKTQTKYYSYQTDVQVGETGGALTPYNKIPQFTLLPSTTTPVVVFLGTSTGGSQAIFLVAKDVSSVGGEGVCYPTPDSCQLLGLNAGKGADLIYSVDHKTYHLQVTRIKRVVSSKPPAG